MEKNIDDSQGRWRKAVFASNLVYAVIIFVAELSIFGVLEYQGLRTQSLGEYLYRYLFLPTVLDGIILAGGYFFMRFFKEKPVILNYIPMVQMVLICFMLSTVHHVFYVVFCTFCFPIFISVIFNDKKATRVITALSFVCLTAAQILGPKINAIENEFQLSNYLVAAIILITANVLCNLLIQFQKQKDRKIEMMYRNRMEMLEQMKYDQKTGLHGHTSFQTGLKKLVDEAELRKRPAVAVLDIDDFKKVNDTYGHVKGDMVILELARIMREVCGEKYTAARFGGEEFAILFQNGTIDDYIRTVETIRTEIEQMKFDFREEPVTLSAGIAIWKRGWGVTEFFDRADEALYISKRQGKNRTTVCDGDSVKSAALYQWLSAVPDRKNQDSRRN